MANWIIAVMGFVFIGCSVQHDMSEMLSNTQAMNSKTSSMSQSMENLCQGGREDAAAGKGPLSLANLRSHPSIHDKLADAAIYIFSFEFQHWKICIDGTPEFRETLFTKALELFFAETDDMFDYTSLVPFNMNHDFSVDPGSGWLPPNDNWKSLGVLSYMIARNDYNLEIAAKTFDFKAVSFYDLITQALAMREKHQHGEKIPDWAAMVFRFEDRALQFLQLRHNFLPLMVLGKIDHFDKSIWTQGRMRFETWTYDFDKFNDDQLRQQIGFLKDAEQTRSFLRGIGEDIQWYSLVRHVYANVQFVSAKNPVAAQILNNETTAAVIAPDSREALAKDLRDGWATIATVQKIVPPPPAPEPSKSPMPNWNEWMSNSITSYW